MQRLVTMAMGLGLAWGCGDDVGMANSGDGSSSSGTMPDPTRGTDSTVGVDSTVGLDSTVGVDSTVGPDSTSGLDSTSGSTSTGEAVESSSSDGSTTTGPAGSSTSEGTEESTGTTGGIEGEPDARFVLVDEQYELQLIEYGGGIVGAPVPSSDFAGTDEEVVTSTLKAPRTDLAVFATNDPATSLGRSFVIHLGDAPGVPSELNQPPAPLVLGGQPDYAAYVAPTVDVVAQAMFEVDDGEIFAGRIEAGAVVDVARVLGGPDGLEVERDLLLGDTWLVMAAEDFGLAPRNVYVAPVDAAGVGAASLATDLLASQDVQPRSMRFHDGESGVLFDGGSPFEITRAYYLDLSGPLPGVAQPLYPEEVAPGIPVDSRVRVVRPGSTGVVFEANADDDTTPYWSDLHYVEITDGAVGASIPLGDGVEQGVRSVGTTFGPDGSLLVYIGRFDDPSTHDAYLVSFDGGSPGPRQRLSAELPAGGRAAAPRFSPDGAYIYYLSQPVVPGPFAVMRVQVADGVVQPPEPISAPGQECAGFELSPAGDLVVLRVEEGFDETLHLADVQGAVAGPPVLVHPPLRAGLTTSGVEWSATGRILAYRVGTSSSSEPATVYLTDLDAGGPGTWVPIATDIRGFRELSRVE